MPFPEGSGIVTKCPIVVRTRQAQSEEWFVDDVRVESRSQVEGRIRQAQQRRLNAVNVLSDAEDDMQPLKVSREEIKVTYLSPDNVDLVVVDLPGGCRGGRELTVLRECLV